MNRDILFRGKRADNGNWVYGYLVRHPSAVQIGDYSNPWYIHVPAKDPDSSGGVYNVLFDTIGQYTGLTDKNGVKIFEGDIVRTHYANAKKADFVEYIVFHNGRFCATPDDEHCWIDLADGVRHPPQDKAVYMEWCEVIGNIHDNPELLKEV